MSKLIGERDSKGDFVSLFCRDPFGDSEDEEDGGVTLRPMKMDIDLGLTTYANARRSVNLAWVAWGCLLIM